jgi:hypothetical protein
MTFGGTLPVDGPAKGSATENLRHIGVRRARLRAVQSLI